MKMPFRFFFKKKNKEVPQSLEQIWQFCQSLEQDFDKLTKDFESFKRKSHFFIQKIGIVRFNPFKETGGDQSFSIALLDGNNSGLVVTSLYTREKNRIYAKPIKQGEPEYQLSAEEKEAIVRAIDSGNSKLQITNRKP